LIQVPSVAIIYNTPKIRVNLPEPPPLILTPPSGTQTGLSAGETHTLKAVAVVFSIAGFVFNLAVLGIAVDLIRDWIETNERQNGRVVENDHIVILGWSDKIPFLLLEISYLQWSCPIVIVAEKDEFYMQNEVRALSKHHVHMNEVHAHDGDLLPSLSDADKEMQSKIDKSTNLEKRVTVWSGSPQDPMTLEKISLLSAKAVIILGTDGEPRVSDQEVIRSVLAVESLLPHLEPPAWQLFAEIKLNENKEVLSAITGTSTRKAITSRAVVAEVLVKSALNPMIGDALVDMLSFGGGEELYVRSLPDCHGMRVDAVQKLHPTAVILGRRTNTQAKKMQDEAENSPRSHTRRAWRCQVYAHRP